MILIFGGAYQGKKDFAVEKFGIKEEDIFECDREVEDLPGDKRLINNADQFVLGLVEKGLNPERYFTENMERFEDTILIFEDISCGIVPMDKIERRWREENGRAVTLCAKNAKQVYRVFCGIGCKVK